MGRGVELFLSNMLFFIAIGYVCISIGLIWTFGFIIQWYIRTKKSAKHSLPLPHVNRSLAKIRNTVYAGGIIACFACILIGVVLEILGGMPPQLGLMMFIPFLAVFVGLWIRRQVDTKKRTRIGNIKLTVVVLVVMTLVLAGGTALAFMEIPFLRNTDSLGDRPALTLSDVGVSAPARYSDIIVGGTPAVPVDYEYWAWTAPGDGSVRTHICSSVNTTLTVWLYDYWAEDFAREFRYALAETPASIGGLTSDEAAFWGAETGMTLHDASSTGIELLLRNGKTVLRISASGTNMRLESVQQAVQKLWDQ